MRWVSESELDMYYRVPVIVREVTSVLARKQS